LPTAADFTTCAVIRDYFRRHVLVTWASAPWNFTRGLAARCTRILTLLIYWVEVLVSLTSCPQLGAVVIVTVAIFRVFDAITRFFDTCWGTTFLYNLPTSADFTNFTVIRFFYRMCILIAFGGIQALRNCAWVLTTCCALIITVIYSRIKMLTSRAFSSIFKRSIAQEVMSTVRIISLLQPRFTPVWSTYGWQEAF
jgi:hypothetical protein